MSDTPTQGFPYVRMPHFALVAGFVSLSAATTFAAFPPPITANPAADYTATIAIDYQSVQTFSRILTLDINDPLTQYPPVYWFKYTSNGRSAVKFDTLGSDFGTNGPGNPSGGGMVLGSYNQSQIAVYRADGTPVAISKGTRNLAGDPIPIFPTYSSNPTQWFVPQGLSELYFERNAPPNPHWAADPNDPTPYTAWAAPGNEGNSQKYFPPHYPTALNQYQVWATALSPIMLDAQGNPVINPNTGQPRPQPGWRYFDRARYGPGTPWNRFEILEEGDYWIAVSSAGVTFAGDTYVEEVLRAPIHFDVSTGTPNVPQLAGPLGNFQYYIGQGSQIYYGTIVLNVTHEFSVPPVPEPASLGLVAAARLCLMRRRGCST